MGRSSSSSAQSTEYTTNNIDRRLVVGNEGVGLTADNSTVSITTSDPGTVARALDSVDVATSSVRGGYADMIGAAERLFKASSDNATKLAGQTEQAVLDAYRNAEADKGGTIDNRTIIVLAVAGAAALAFVASRKKG